MASNRFQRNGKWYRVVLLRVTKSDTQGRPAELMKRPGRPFQLQLRGEVIEGGGQCVFVYFKPRGGMWTRCGALVLDFYDHDLAVSNFDDDMREAWRRIRAYAKLRRNRGTTPEERAELVEPRCAPKREWLFCPRHCTVDYEPVRLIPGQRCPECRQIALFNR